MANAYLSPGHGSITCGPTGEAGLIDYCILNPCLAVAAPRQTPDRMFSHCTSPLTIDGFSLSLPLASGLK